MELEGEVRDPRFLRDLVAMGQERLTGAIRLERKDLIKILYLQDGEIISASTNDPAESVDEILLRARKVTREHIQQALVKRKEHQTLGDALLAAGFVSRKELRWARRHQIIAVLRSAVGETGWQFTVVPDYVSSRSSEGTRFPVEPILIELIVTDPDRKRVDERLEGGEVRLRKAPHFTLRYPDLGLNEDADRVAALVDGRRTAAEIAAEAGGNGFMNLKLLAALRILGLFEINPKAHEQLEISFDPEEHGNALLPGVDRSFPDDLPEWEIEPDSLETDRAPDVGSGDDPSAENLESNVSDDWSLEDETEDPPMNSEVPMDQHPDDFESSGGPTTDLDVLESETVLAGPDSPRPHGRWRVVAAIAIALILVLIGWLLYRERSSDRERDSHETRGKSPIEDRRSEPDVPLVVTSEVEVDEDASDPTPPVENPSAAPDGSASETGDPLRKRYDRMARDYAQEAGRIAHTVQFEIVCQTSSITLALEVGGGPVWFVPIDYRGEPCFRVFWGRYQTEDAATRAIDEIPRELRGLRPVVIQPGRVIE